MKKIKYFSIGALFLFISCSSSRITSAWKAEQVQPRKFNKILVLALLRETDGSLRQKMEVHMLGDLKELGYNAICACEEFGPKAFHNMTEKEAIAKLANDSIDGVVTIVLLNKTIENYYVPGRDFRSSYHARQDHFWGYYTSMNDRIYSPSYYMVNTKYFWESNFYDLRDKQLLYSAQTRSFNPASSERLAHSYGRLIIKNMVSNEILKMRDTDRLITADQVF